MAGRPKGARGSGGAGRGRGSGSKRGRASGGAAPSASPAAKVGRFSPQYRANQKLAENFRDFEAPETDGVVNPADGRTLRQRLEHDIDSWDKGKYVRWGKGYNECIRRLYRSPQSLHAKLAVGLEDPSVVDPALKKAILFSPLLFSSLCSPFSH